MKKLYITFCLLLVSLCIHAQMYGAQNETYIED